MNGSAINLLGIVIADLRSRNLWIQVRRILIYGNKIGFLCFWVNMWTSSDPFDLILKSDFILKGNPRGDTIQRDSGPWESITSFPIQFSSRHPSEGFTRCWTISIQMTVFYILTPGTRLRGIIQSGSRLRGSSGGFCGGLINTRKIGGTTSKDFSFLMNRWLVATISLQYMNLRTNMHKRYFR